MAIGWTPTCVSAQNLLVEIVSSESSAPISGVMVTLTRSGSTSPVGRALTNSVGKHLFVGLSAGRYSVRAEVIGFGTRDYGPVEVEDVSTSLAHLSMDRMAIALEGLSVEGQRRCRVRPEEGSRLAAVWDEARKALTGVAWTQNEGIYRYRVLKSTRDVELDTQLGRPVDRSVSSRWLRSPFESRDAKELVEQGFVQRAPDGDADLYFAPDAAVLLSDEFLDTHCFRLRMGSGERQGMVGLAFEPTRSQRTPDINGVLWIRTDGWVLDRADFWYENLPDGIRSSLVGGYVRFQRLPSGAWIVPEWEIRMPSVGVSRDASGARRTSLIGTREVLGRVLRIEEAGGRLLLTSETGTIEGVVLDSLGTEPVVGALVLIEGGAEEIVTDERGEFRVTELPPGRYTVVVTPPRESTVSDEPMRELVDVADGAVEFVRFRTPSRAEVLATACQDEEGDLPPRTSVLLGTVRDSGSGLPLPNVTVRITWDDIRFRAQSTPTRSGWDYRILESGRGLEVTTDQDGIYRACAIPELTPLRIVANMGWLASTTDTLRIPEAVPVYSLDLALHLSTPATLVGRVEDWTSGEPVETAMVRLTRIDIEADGATATTVTVASTAAGRFETEPLPAGLWALEVSRLGYSTVLDTISVDAGSRTEILVRLPAQALEIEGLTVQVLSRAGREARVSGTAFDYISPEDMAEVRDRTLTVLDVLRMKGPPRLVIKESGGSGIARYCIESTRPPPSIAQGAGQSCNQALIVLDGVIISAAAAGGGELTAQVASEILGMNPEEIHSVRFMSPMEARFRWGQDMGRFGALVIETRRGGR